MPKRRDKPPKLHDSPRAAVAKDGPGADSSEQKVDSRAYSFAYLLNHTSQLPADFPTDDTFEHGVFLPRELVPRFDTPRYVPRLLLQGADGLQLYYHPAYGSGKELISFQEISHIEFERFLTDCSLVFATPCKSLHVPFHGRDRDRAEAFLARLKTRLLDHDKSTKHRQKPKNFGSPLDHKFKQIEVVLQVEAETVIARFFVAPKQTVKARLFSHETSWSCASELLLTSHELHYFSDDKDGYRQPYGFRASWVPLHKVVGIQWDTAINGISVFVLGGHTLRVPVPDELRTEGERFVQLARRYLHGERE